ncbi:hypothetical protein GIB67_040991 [Kingdonia uniflora]|uniref:Aminotransferase-like plant mobile domain-containing protein n=1 Tax=Kingdonia uniflora TaxID=39325 RepID=A0A7J7NBU9_9MAGN|nr:hypothetical protein GIB67_040991 [Kingdonia uniflora]
MDVKLSRPTSNAKKREAKQDVGLAMVNKHHPSYKRKKNMNEGIKTDKEPQIEQFGDVDFNDESTPQRNDLGGGSAEEALGAQLTEGDAMNEDNVEAPPMSEEPQTEVSPKEIAAPIDDAYSPNRSLLLSFKFHRARSIYLGQPETNIFYFSWGEVTLSLDDVQHLIGLSTDGDVPITEGSWSLPKLVEIFKKNLYQDEDFFNSMKTGGQDNSLSLVKLVNFYAGKLEKYNDSIHNERPVGQKKKAMSALSVACTYMLYVLGTFLLPVRKGSYVNARYLYFFENDKVNIKWSWGFAVLAHLFHNLGTTSRIDGNKFTAYMTLLESWIFAHFPRLPGIPKEQHSDATEYCTRWKWGLSITDRTGARELLKYREAFDNYKVEDDPYRAERRSDRDLNENTFFNGLTSSPDHVEPIYPNRVVRQFARIQPIPKNLKCVEVSGLRTWDGDEPKQYKPKYDWVDVFSKGLWKEWIATECKQLWVRIEQMKHDRILNDVVHEQYVKSFEKLPTKLEEKTNLCEVLNDCNESLSRELAKKTKECQVLNVENTKLVEDMRIKIGVDAFNASLKKIDELTAKYEDVVKRLKEKESFIIASNYRWVAKFKSGTAIHDKKIKTLRSQLIIVEEMKKKLEVEHYEWEAWRQIMNKEFHSGKLAEKDDPTFIELFDQYDRFYTIAQ